MIDLRQGSRTLPSLPPPLADAARASDELLARIAREIAAADGWIGFDRYMQRVLYEPGLGYYSGGAHKFGAAGDFVTAPLISPLFGACVATQLAQWLAGVPHRITEFGAGSGELAVQLLEALASQGIDDVRYDIVELSADLARRQREMLASRLPAALSRVRWLDRMPDALSGVVIGNEVLDAMPVKLFAASNRLVFERGVSYEPASAGEAPRLCWSDRPADRLFAAEVEQVLATAGWPEVAAFDSADAYVSELGQQARAWTSSVSSRLERGVVLLFDYGFPAGEYFHPQRRQGTLMCHYRHRAHADPFFLPGLQDLTSHVDFDAIACAAVDAGADLLGYTSQANFLLGCGLLDQMTDSADRLAYARHAQAVQRLVSEAEMGELFKVIAFGRGVADDALGFARGDRRHRLAASNASSPTGTRGSR